MNEDQPVKKGADSSYYPFSWLDVGEGFNIERIGVVYEDTDKKRKLRDTAQNRASVACCTWAKRYAPHAKFSVKVVDDELVRVTRVL